MLGQLKFVNYTLQNNRRDSERFLIAMWSPKTTFHTYMNDFPVRETELVQLGGGPLALRAEMVFGADAVLSKVKCDANTVWRMLAAKDWVGLVLPITWQGTYKLDGWEAAPGDVFLLDGRVEFTTSASNRTSIMLAIRRTRLIEAIHRIAGSNFIEIDPNHVLLQLHDNQLHQLKSRITRMFSVTKFHRDFTGGLFMPPTHEKDMFSFLGEFLLECVPKKAYKNLLPSRDFKTVGRALQFARKNRYEDVNLATLCEGAGVGRTNLYQAFDGVYGITPMQFIYKLRLTGAKEWLSDPSDPPQSVKQAALKYGFVSFGRFAKNYRELFGESPSETLLRAR